VLSNTDFSKIKNKAIIEKSAESQVILVAGGFI
jgi:hypothetical protein